MLDIFTNSIASLLETAFSPGGSTFKAKREKMWGTFHRIRCDEEYRGIWQDMMKKSVGCNASPIFYQYVTDKLFRKLIITRFPVQGSGSDSSSKSTELSYEEDNALRYVAGYVCRAVRKQLKREKASEELFLSLDELIDDTEHTANEIVEDSDDDDDDTKHWIRLSNRGGLIFVTDEAFTFFSTIEQVIRHYLRVDRVKELSVGMRKEIKKSIVEDVDVKANWSVVAQDMDEDVGSVLLGKIIDVWITIRGFSFAGAYMELYKQRAKTTLQRSKGLRKKLQTT